MAISRSTSGIFLFRVTKKSRRSLGEGGRGLEILQCEFLIVLEQLARRLRQTHQKIMRGFIIRDVTIEEIHAARCLQAVEGYLELGMFGEAEAELRELDPAWFASQHVLSLQLRVLVGLNEV